MPHRYTAEILRAAAATWDMRRVATADQRYRTRLWEYGDGMLGSREWLIMVRDEGKCRGLELDSLAEGIYRTHYESAKAEYLLKWPATWLTQGLWWTLHPDLSEDWLDLTYQMDQMHRITPQDGLYTEQLLDMMRVLFDPQSVTTQVLIPHLSATFQPEDRLALLAGTTWALGHLAWPAMLLYYHEHPDQAGSGHVSMVEGTTALLLADLQDDWLPGRWMDDRRHFREIAERARQAGQQQPSENEPGAGGAGQVITLDPRAVAVTFPGGDRMEINLVDGRTLGIPLSWSHRLTRATVEQRAQVRISASGAVLSWPSVDEDIEVAALLGAGQLIDWPDNVALPEPNDSGAPPRDREGGDDA